MYLYDEFWIMGHIHKKYSRLNTNVYCQTNPSTQINVNFELPNHHFQILLPFFLISKIVFHQIVHLAEDRLAFIPLVSTWWWWSSDHNTTHTIWVRQRKRTRCRRDTKTLIANLQKEILLKEIFFWFRYFAPIFFEIWTTEETFLIYVQIMQYYQLLL